MVDRRSFLDEIDKTIIEMLQKDAKSPPSKIAERCQISSQSTIKYRIERLEEEGIIQGYHAQINLSAHQEEFNTCLELTSKIEPGQIPKVEALLQNIPEIWAVYSVLGRKNYIILAKTANQQAFMEKIYTNLMNSNLFTEIDIKVIAKVLKTARTEKFFDQNK